MKQTWNHRDRSLARIGEIFSALSDDTERNAFVEVIAISSEDKAFLPWAQEQINKGLCTSHSELIAQYKAHQLPAQ